MTTGAEDGGNGGICQGFVSGPTGRMEGGCSGSGEVLPHPTLCLLLYKPFCGLSQEPQVQPTFSLLFIFPLGAKQDFFFWVLQIQLIYFPALCLKKKKKDSV